jgi:hypothetical protein
VDDGALLGGSKMKRICLISLVVCLGIAAPAAAGDLWVICATGFEIFLDGKLIGSCDAAVTGTRVSGIETGEHTIQVRKEGFASAVFPFTVGSASAQILVPEVTGDPSGTAEEGGVQPLGTVQITSNPRSCMVGSGERAIEKQQPIMTFVGVPFGKHNLLFESAGAILEAHVNVQTLEPVQVRVDFSNEQVVIIGGTIDRAESGSAADEEGAEAEPECIEYWVQVTRANSFEELEPIQDHLEDRGFPPYQQRIVSIEGDGVLPLYKLYVGPIEGKEKAKWAKDLVRHAGFKSAFVVPEKCVPRERRKREFRPIH